ncbi:MAG: stage III sporulation protein AF [Clostridiales bacterium]|nr:stage III sporulation protein AF [Clostridiales bacterium]
MENIYAYIRNIGCFMVFASVVRLLVPQGSFRDYINLFLGLIFTVIMLNPLSAFIKTDLPKLQDYIIKNGAAAAELFEAAEDEGSETVYSTYKKMAEERTAELCSGYIEEAEVSVLIDENFNISEVYIKGKIIKDCAELIKLISKLYGTEEDKIITAGEWKN